MKTQIIIDKNGNIITFKEDITKEIVSSIQTKQVKEKRVSYITPENILLRILFKILRKIFKDDHYIANWTRRWRCRWQIEVIETRQVIKGFTDRNKAVEVEKEIISKLLLKEELL